MKTAVLLSGGVDSSVVLSILKKQGYDVTAFYLKIWLQDEFSFLGDCPWETDLNYAYGVCKQLGVPLEVVSMQNEYWDNVVSYTIKEIKAGHTPNPDIFCNSLIKFGMFYDKIDSSFEKVASGHYASVDFADGKYRLLRAPDPVKDQTYFLALLKQSQLSRALFPIGVYNKDDVRRIAHENCLPTMDRKDSQGICFLGKIKFTDFVKYHLGELPGDIIELETGKKLGTHNGYYFFTIGQRSGLRLGGGPWFVVQKDVKNNIIYISKENITRRYRNKFTAGRFNWIAETPPAKTALRLKIRHGERFYNCSIEFLENDLAEVTIDPPDQGIAPGQFAVFYDGEVCLGGGVII